MKVLGTRAGERSVAQLSRLLLTAQRVPSLKGNWQSQECCAPPAAAVPKAAVLGLSCEPQTCTIIRSFQLEQILQISTSNHHAALPHPITKQCSWCHVLAPLKYLHRLPGQPFQRLTLLTNTFESPYCSAQSALAHQPRPRPLT